MLLLLHGSDPYLVAERVTAAFDGDAPLRLGPTETQEAEDALRSRGLLGEPILIAVQIPDGAAEALASRITVLAALMESPDRVVLFAQAKLPAAHKVAAACRAAGGTVEEVTPPAGDALVAEVVRRAAAMGATLDTASARYLAEAFGPSPGRLAREVEKAALLALAGCSGDIRELCRSERLPDRIEFQLADAFAERDGPRAVELLDRTLAAGREPFELVGLLASKVRALVAVSVAGAADDRVAAATKLHPFVVRLARRQVRRWDAAALRQAYGALLRLDERLKRGARQSGPAMLAAFLVRSAGRDR